MWRFVVCLMLFLVVGCQSVATPTPSPSPSEGAPAIEPGPTASSPPPVTSSPVSLPTPPNFFDPSNIRLTFPLLTDADLQKAKDILAASTDNVTGGSSADWSRGVDSGRDGTVIFTELHSSDQVVYKIWIKDYGKPTEQILGFGKLDANGDIEPSSTQ
jgi:hypothetical protein